MKEARRPGGRSSNQRQARSLGRLHDVITGSATPLLNPCRQHPQSAGRRTERRPLFPLAPTLHEIPKLRRRNCPQFPPVSTAVAPSVALSLAPSHSTHFGSLRMELAGG